VLNDCKIEQDPGDEYVYSNFGYCLLGRIIEKVSGMSYIDYVRHEIGCFEVAGNTQG
jgi:CubicO group peptidase (beta-lactamase class C family)